MSQWGRLVGSDEYAQALMRARRQFTAGQAATVRDLRRVYTRAASAVRQDIVGLTEGSLRASHLQALAVNLERRARELNRGVLEATHRGIWLGSQAGVQGPTDIASMALAGTFPAPDVRRLFAGINERAVLAMLARTRKDGLTLSDRIWRVGERWRNAAARVVEDGVARGLDPRRLGREAQRYLQPGVWTPHKLETRRRLKVPADVSYEGMRLARTEGLNACHEGMVAANQGVPGYRGIYWRLSDMHPAPDVCDDMARDVSHGEPGFYPQGLEPARPHPQCLCVALPAYEPPEQLAGRLRQWVDEPGSQPDLETWYVQTGQAYLQRPPRFSLFSGRVRDPDDLIAWSVRGGHQLTEAQISRLVLHASKQPFRTWPAKMGARGRVHVDAEILAVLNERAPDHGLVLGTWIGRRTRLPSDVTHWIRHRAEFGNVGYAEYHRRVRDTLALATRVGEVYTYRSVYIPEGLVSHNLCVLIPNPLRDPDPTRRFWSVIYSEGRIVTGFAAPDFAMVTAGPARTLRFEGVVKHR